MDASLKAIADYGLSIVAVVALAAALWWVYRERINDLKAERDAWRDIALRGLDVGEGATSLAEHAVRKGRR